jgi:putative tryptophan/tyrosine transport system substrate-binding protein
MNRRTFLLHGFEVALGLTALPMLARGQASPRIVGFLRNTTGAGYEVLVAAFREGLAESGLVEGRDVVIEFRWGNNRPELLPMLVTDLVRMRAAVIVTNAGAASAVRAAAKDIQLCSYRARIRSGWDWSRALPGRREI